jgi:ferredoxin
MNVRAQISMVMNLDKCIGCHTCSVACKNVWTNRPGAEYMWWNNVETRPGPGYPRHWENQDRYNGGWALDGGKLKLRIEIKKDYKPPGLDDYYHPWTYDYEVLFSEKQTDQQPVARPISLIDGRPMDVAYGPNWNDDLAGTDLLLEDPNLDPVQKSIYAQFKDVFYDVSAEDLQPLPKPLLPRGLPQEGPLQEGGGRHSARGSEQVPRLQILRDGLPLQEGVLQLEGRQVGEVHLLLPEDRGWATHRLLADVRRED